ncbi:MULTISPECIES: flagellar filament capping protein FliD [Gilliamella]|uniref:flagellar filament capping protein FliD n=1 Tax=Gilliamella TaxID=1193503 RepID=UPI0004D5A688|nr:MULTISPECIES: flagellar filament capping protein FliD [Gilliamella]KES16810.1 Flagellar capping protein [Gilliamella apis SCGC AB-598-P17]MBI0114149.1 flagellar filament capping protein FliD [Gilliamella sp. W8123]MBI0117686.1 flagellar filament capping protein FliD [Gilliamella sp. W8129]
MAMSILGIGSGIDLNEVLDQLEAVEKNRLTPIKAQQKAVNNKISGFGKLKSALSTFNSATAKLQKKELFQARFASGNDNYFTTNVNSKAQLGNYAVSVEQLATAHSVATNAINDKTSALGNDNETRTLTIEQANGQKLNITLGKDDTSLESIANAINQAKVINEDGSTSETTVNATIVRSGTDSYQLVITSKETGEQQAITSISSDDDKLNSLIGFNANQADSSAMSEVAKAQDAKFSFNGITINSSSNTVKEVIPGVDITLKAVTTTAQNLTISADNDKAQEALKEWVDAFNQLQSTISSLTQFTAGDANSDELNNSNGPLIGDSTLRNIDQSIRSIFSKGQTGELSVLAQIGINMDSNGKLVIKENELEKALKENSEAVAILFTGDGETTGIANEVFAKVSSFIDSDGMIDTATNGLNSTLKSLDKRYDQVNNSIDQTIERYRVQFTKLDILINELNGMSNYLTTQFEMMANLKK